MHVPATLKKIMGASACIAIAAAVGCDGGNSQSAPQLAQPAQQNGVAQFSIKFPGTSGSSNQQNQRPPKYVSPGANSATITFNGTTVTVSQNSNGQCTTGTGGARICSVTVPIPAGTYTFSATTWDGPTGNGNQLGSGTVTATVSPGQTTPVSITFNSIVASAVMIITSGSGSGGCSFVPGLANTCSVIVDAKDADGFHIIGPGNYTTPITLTNSDTSGATTLSTTTATAPQQAITFQYNGSAAIKSVTIGGSAPGVPAANITVGSVTIGTPSPAPSASASASVAPTSLASTPAPSATPAATPSPATSSGFAPVCNQTAQTAGNPYSFISIEGNVPAGGGAFTVAANNSATWLKGTLAATSAPSAAPSSSASAAPSSGPSARPVNLYFGSYSITGSTGNSAGCLVALATQNGTALGHVRAPQSALRFPRSGGSASLLGFPNIASNTTFGPPSSNGTVTGVNLTLNSSGASSGTFTLSDGSTGTLSLTFASTQNVAPLPTPAPSASPTIAPGPISVTYNGAPLNGQTLPGPGNVLINVSVPNYTGQVSFAITSCNAPAQATFSGSFGTAPNTSFQIQTVTAGNTCAYLVAAGLLGASGSFTP